MTTPQPQSRHSLIMQIFKYKALLVCSGLIIGGVVFLCFASVIEGESLMKHLLRDVGVVLITTGSVVFLADYITRRDFLTILSEELSPIRKEMEPMRKDISSLMNKLLDELKPLRAEIPTLNTVLDDVRKCIALGSTMSALGIKQIHENRRACNLHHHLKSVRDGSEVKLLGIIASEISTPAMQEIIRNKIRAGCTFKILCLDPESKFVRQRAWEERREYDDMKDDVASSNRGTWKNFVERGLARDVKSRDQVEFKCYDSSPRYFLFITEEVVVVGFYLGRQRGADGPHLELEVKEGGIAHAYIEHFDLLWQSEDELAAPAPAAAFPVEAKAS